ncbi:MAG TPA: hypothetical protein PLH57_03795 [Oligoflexia bacterium]|nr:hypothetical protein [Oligoflexia bacterium]
MNFNFVSKVTFVALAIGFAFGCTKNKTTATPGKISGRIVIDQQLVPSLKPTDTLFIIARNQQSGPPTAVKRIVNPTFPLEYVIGPEDAMMGGTGGFEAGAQLTIAARLSRSGDAMPAAGDIEGVHKDNPALVGSGGVDVLIDRVRP